MSWHHSRSSPQPALPASPRSVSPQCVPCSPSQLSQSSASRMLGTDITNRSPTPPPPPLPSSGVGFVKQSSCSVDKPDAVRLPTPPSLHTQLLNGSSCVGTDITPGFGAAATFDLPTCEAYLTQFRGRPPRDDDRDGAPSTRRRPRPDEIAVTPVLSSAERQWREEEENEVATTLRSQLPSMPVVGEENDRTGGCGEWQQPIKRLRSQWRAELPSVQPLSLNGSLTSPQPHSGGSEERCGDTEACTGCSAMPSRAANGSPMAPTGSFFTPISAQLLFPLSSDDAVTITAAAKSRLTRKCAEARWFCETESPQGLLCTEPCADVALCVPARHADPVLPSWQAMCSASLAEGEGNSGLLDVTPSGDRRVQLVSAVDGTVVYSMDSLPDVSPIACLSERWRAQGPLQHQQLCEQRVHPAETELCRCDEEIRRWVTLRSEEKAVDPLFAPHDESAGPQPSLPVHNKVEQETQQGVSDGLEAYGCDISATASERASSTSRNCGALQLAADAFDDLQSDLLRWQRGAAP